MTIIKAFIVVVTRRIFPDGSILRIEFPDGLWRHDPEMVETVNFHMIYHIAIETCLQGIIRIDGRIGRSKRQKLAFARSSPDGAIGSDIQRQEVFRMRIQLPLARWRDTADSLVAHRTPDIAISRLAEIAHITNFL